MIAYHQWRGDVLVNKNSHESTNTRIIMHRANDICASPATDLNRSAATRRDVQCARIETPKRSVKQNTPNSTALEKMDQAAQSMRRRRRAQPRHDGRRGHTTGKSAGCANARSPSASRSKPREIGEVSMPWPNCIRQKPYRARLWAEAGSAPGTVAVRGALHWVC